MNVIMIINHNRHQVSDSKMLDGVRGKQRKVVCKAAPQSNLKVTIPIDIFLTVVTHMVHNINQLSNLPQLYINLSFKSSLNFSIHGLTSSVVHQSEF